MPYSEPHFRHWPPGVPQTLQLPDSSLTDLVAAMARRISDEALLTFFHAIHAEVKGE